MINNKYKTVMCKHFEQTGQCYMGAKCHFAHGSQELRGLNDPLPSSPLPGNTPSRQPGSFSGQSPQTGAGNYKTVKCRFFEKGLCKHNQNCSFAHGDQEVRQSKGYSGSQGGGSGSMSMQNMMQPMYDPSLQNQVVFQQIQLLANEMKNYHAKDTDLSAQIKQATELNSSGNIQGAASILYGLMDRPTKTKQDSDTYNSFSVKMQELGATMYQTFQMQQYTQQMASPQMDYSPMGGYSGMYNQGYSGQGYQKSQEYNGGSFQGQDKGHSGQSYGANNYNYGGHQGGHQGGHDSHPDNQGQY